MSLLKARSVNDSVVRWPIFQFIISWLLFVVNTFCNKLKHVQFIIKYSALGSHILIFLESFSWALESLICNKKVTLKVGSYIIATFVDICGGIISLHLVMGYVAATRPLSEHLLDIAEVIAAFCGIVNPYFYQFFHQQSFYFFFRKLCKP